MDSGVLVRVWWELEREDGELGELQLVLVPKKPKKGSLQRGKDGVGL